MSEPQIVKDFLIFIQSQKINMTKLSKFLFKLPETQVQDIPATIFLKLDKNPELIIKLRGSEYQKLPESVTQTIPEYNYLETGVFKISLELKKTFMDLLNDISCKTQSLFSKIKAKEEKNHSFAGQFNDHLVSKFNSIKNFQVKKLVCRVDKKKYLKLKQIGETLWLGDLIFITEPNELNDNINVTCMLENKKKREMMVLKIIQDLSTFDSFEQFFFEFGLNIHENFTINERIYNFFCDPIPDWLEFSLTNQLINPNGSLDIYYWFPNIDSKKKCNILKEDLNNPMKFLASISAEVNFCRNSLRLGSTD